MTSVALGMPISRRADAAAAAVTDPARPAVPGLVDRFGRAATDLRVSLIDKCNLRCGYCMPADGLPWLPKDELLTDDEIVRLIAVATAELGVTEVRFTGGEPLLRKGIVDIVRRVAELPRRPSMSLTSNALLLGRLAGPLAAAGLDRVNVSLDSVRPDTFAELTRRDRLTDTLAGLRAAADAGLRPIKLNAVLLRGVNDDQAVELLEFALQQGYQLRFIEQMPLDAGHHWQRGDMVTAGEIQQQLAQRFSLRPHPAPRDGAPAELFDVLDAGEVRGTVGIIASVTRPFCGDCDRTRLTADGAVRSCLFSQTETDLRGLLRAGASDEQLAQVWRGAMWGKPAGHGIDRPDFLQPRRPMSAIGG
ncbi:GTP 3',8-cyclase MoaA [Nakamurella aerolata]|uniref:GTP 3',8-cyclase n=1 Tax=Nakamurella aerolata TaxID=1656892 RepID=A0A849A8F7_9ACTN|nr:GTP 3',8-cyclase MoaA [Nakamurella aerolata]NNG35388.1 GTP 3',8-cyclase MoaA [Nakamurella aerolata]